MRSHLILFGCALLATAGQSIGAQNTPTSDNHAPSFRSTTRAVVVDVVVSKGEAPVMGLGKQQFQLFEDGKPQAIDFFEEHLAKVLPARALQPLPKMPPGVYTNVPPAPTNDSVNVLLLGNEVNSRRSWLCRVADNETVRATAGLSPAVVRRGERPSLKMTVVFVI